MSTYALVKDAAKHIHQPNTLGHHNRLFPLTQFGLHRVNANEGSSKRSPYDRAMFVCAFDTIAGLGRSVLFVVAYYAVELPAHHDDAPLYTCAAKSDTK